MNNSFKNFTEMRKDGNRKVVIYVTPIIDQLSIMGLPVPFLVIW